MYFMCYCRGDVITGRWMLRASYSIRTMLLLTTSRSLLLCLVNRGVNDTDYIIQ